MGALPPAGHFNVACQRTTCISGAPPRVPKLGSRVTRLEIRATRLEIFVTRLAIRATRLEIFVTRLAICVTRLEIFVTRLASRATRLGIFVTRLEILVARLAIRVTRLRSRVTKIPSRPARLASRAASRDPPHPGIPNAPPWRAVYTFYEPEMVERSCAVCNRMSRRISCCLSTCSESLWNPLRREARSKKKRLSVGPFWTEPIRALRGI